MHGGIEREDRVQRILAGMSLIILNLIGLFQMPQWTGWVASKFGPSRSDGLLAHFAWLAGLCGCRMKT